MTELAMHAADRDIADTLCEQVRSAYDARTPLRIVGGDTRAFMADRWKAKRCR
ncbi:hypothetical protein HSBAA_52270 [Vreelandella sulfidaeris]|uniref:Uncharacterized protein n=1 Tax=Vreelandella sulfidaeris TaxID=115553 RepID=A0A455UGZ9_9GAMM|nr:hypothetical protein HSBAA_52270 [Halomonas sulfidaeris]